MCSNACSSGLFYELCGKAVCQNHSFRQAEICGGSTRQKTLIVPPSIKESETFLTPKQNLKNASSVSQVPAPSLRGTADTFSQASVSTSARPEATVSVVLEEDLTEDSIKSTGQPLPSAAVDSPSLTTKPLGLAAGEEEQEDEKPALKLSVSRMESVSMRSDETPTRKANSDLAALPAEVPTISMYLATANFLLDVGALKVRAHIRMYVRTYAAVHMYICCVCACGGKCAMFGDVWLLLWFQGGAVYQDLCAYIHFIYVPMYLCIQLYNFVHPIEHVNILYYVCSMLSLCSYPTCEQCSSWPASALVVC